MPAIDSDRLAAALSALGDLLAEAGDSFHLVVIGGSGLIALDVVSRATQDVDVVALEQRGALVSADPLPTAVAEAAAVVARDLGLEANWLDVRSTALLEHGLPQGFGERLTSHRYGPALRVSFAARIDQIFLKLYAAADRREPRDFTDLRQLGANAAELKAGARWARTHNMPGPFDDELRRTLADLGVEDDGRDA